MAHTGRVVRGSRGIRDGHIPLWLAAHERGHVIARIQLVAGWPLAALLCAGRYRGPSFRWGRDHPVLQRLQFSRPRYSLSREPFGGCRRLRAIRRNAMTSIQSRSRTLLLAVLAAALPAAIPAAQQPAVNPSSPSQPAVPPSAQPGAGPGSQPLVSPSPPSQAPATAASGQAAQTPAPPSWMQGAPSTAAESKLAPVPALPIATAIDKLPVNKLTLPKGFNIEVYAAGLTNARSLRVDDEGNVYVSTRTIDKVYAVTDKNGRKE